MKDAIYQFKVTLKGISPPIWRRFQIHSDATFEHLHIAIQVVMGWEHAHLHEFNLDGLTVTDSQTLAWGSVDGLDTGHTLIKQHLNREKQKCHYIYDFGDYWQHTLLLEKILPEDLNTTYPICLKGKRACPPEDCGGTWGYMRLLEVLQDKNDPEHEEYLEWYGGEIDADTFDLNQINQQFRNVFRYAETKPPFTRPAQKFWDTVSVEDQEKFLQNAFCRICGETTITNFQGRIQKGNLLLEGYCATCGQSIARLIEGK